jgi:hypothetical protein
MSEDLPAVCELCGAQIVPFGTFGHLFIVEEVGPICTECARTALPSHVAFAEEADRFFSDADKKKKKESQ